MFLQPFTVVDFQLSFEIGIQIILFCNLDVFIVHLLKSCYQSGFQCRFALY